MAADLCCWLPVVTALSSSQDRTMQQAAVGRLTIWGFCFF